LSTSLASDELKQAFEIGRTSWPGVAMTIEEFAAGIQGLNPAQDNLARHPADLFLACACCQARPAALELFEREFLQPARPALRRFSTSPDFADEVCQILRARLFGMPPRIATYTGAGPLASWLRMALTRTAIDHLRQTKTYELLEVDVADGILRDTATPESRLLQLSSRESLKRAVASALSRLDARDRTLFRLHYLDGMNIDRIGALFHIHRATVARRIVHLRRDILALLQDEVKGIEGASNSGELRSLWRLAGSEAHLSIERMLKEMLTASPPPPASPPKTS